MRGLVEPLVFVSLATALHAAVWIGLPGAGLSGAAPAGGGGAAEVTLASAPALSALARDWSRPPEAAMDLARPEVPPLAAADLPDLPVLHEPPQPAAPADPAKIAPATLAPAAPADPVAVALLPLPPPVLPAVLPPVLPQVPVAPVQPLPFDPGKLHPAAPATPDGAEAGAPRPAALPAPSPDRAPRADTDPPARPVPQAPARIAVRIAGPGDARPEPRPEPRPGPRPAPKPETAREPDLPPPAPARVAAGQGQSPVAGAAGARPATEGAGQAGAGTLSDGQRAALLADWAGGIRARVERRKAYPREARAARAAGTVVLRLTVGADGGLLAASVAQGSGHAALDAAALDAVRRAGPLPPAPKGFGAERQVFSLPLRFAP